MKMQLIHNVKGISKIIMIFMLLLAFAFGALISYIWTMGFYAPYEFNLPSKPTIVLQDVKFNEQDASHVDITVLNPSYSSFDAVVSRIQVRTLDDDLLQQLTVTSPQLPYSLGRGKSQVFICSWNWANYTGIKLPPSAGKNVEIHVLLSDDTGEIDVVAKPFVSLSVTDAKFNASDLANFKVTVQNMANSVTYVNVTSINVDVATNITTGAITPALPYGLAPGVSPVTFTVPWNWTAYRNQTVTIGVHTQQGYVGYLTRTLP